MDHPGSSNTSKTKFMFYVLLYLSIFETVQQSITFYEGDYGYVGIQNSFPEYEKINNKSILLYNNNQGVWVLGDDNHNDFVFKLSKAPVFAPSLWPEWDNTDQETPETPNLSLRDPTFIPPWRLTLNSSNDVGQVYTSVFSGNYTLQTNEPLPSIRQGLLVRLPF